MLQDGVIPIKLEIISIKKKKQNVSKKKKPIKEAKKKNIEQQKTKEIKTVKNTKKYKLEGKASYYASKFHGRKTASGKIYNENKYTAAHLKLPFGTKVKVTNLNNKLFVIVTITDRGPFGNKGRIIDVSRKAAKDLDMIKAGVIPVKLEILDQNIN